mgnify:CR=1 FL=1
MEGHRCLKKPFVPIKYINFPFVFSCYTVNVFGKDWTDVLPMSKLLGLVWKSLLFLCCSQQNKFFKEHLKSAHMLHLIKTCLYLNYIITIFSFLHFTTFIT